MSTSGPKTFAAASRAATTLQHITRITAIGLALLAFAGWPAREANGQIESLNDIQLWVGSGSNSAGLVIDWNGGPNPQALAWGFRWDGVATGYDMLAAILAADPYFGGVVLTDWGWGWSVDGLGYDLNGNGFDINDPGDHYNPGFVDPDFWGYYTYDGPSAHPWDGGNVWDAAMVGMADRELEDGSWDGWRYTSWDDAGPSPAFAVIPEPGAFALFIVGSLLLVVRRRWNR